MRQSRRQWLTCSRSLERESPIAASQKVGFPENRPRLEFPGMIAAALRQLVPEAAAQDESISHLIRCNNEVIE